MRISDWSSDVCSSDLPSSRRETLRGHAAMLLFAVLISGSFSLGHMAAALIDPGALTALRFAVAAAVIGAVAAATGALRRGDVAAQIGRAACRERGCQYV